MSTSAPLQEALGIASGGLADLSELETHFLRLFRRVSDRAPHHHVVSGTGDQTPDGPRWVWCHVPQVRDKQKTR